MSSALALQEIRRFLRAAEPEVLSVSGRWGVGKTYGWVSALQEARRQNILRLRRYSYVSAFGVKSLSDLKTAVFQSTVRLDAPDIRPTVASLQENLTSIEGLANVAEWGGRKAARIVQKIASATSWSRGAADLIMPAAGLLIRDQLICIDDLERTVSGLEISEILGFVSSLREERNCKVILLLNEEGLGDGRLNFRRYLEKVVDQAIQFTPTPQESSAIALDEADPIAARLRARTEALGITNIRVIKRIRRFLRHLEPILAEFHEGVLDQAIGTIALFGWSIFEPDLAPSIEHLSRLGNWSFLTQTSEPSTQEAQWNALINAYGYSHTDEFDKVLIDGLLAGGFDEEAATRTGAVLNETYENADIRQGIRAPWELFSGTLDQNNQELIEALVASVRQYGRSMSAGDLDSVVKVLRQLQRDDLADEMISVFMEHHQGQRREFFELSGHRLTGEPFDDAVVAAFTATLNERPLERNPVEILLRIARQSGWNRDDVDFLASLSEDQYYGLFHDARGDDLRSMIRAALGFQNIIGVGESELTISRRARTVLERISAESELNRLRLRPYLPQQETDAASAPNA